LKLGPGSIGRALLLALCACQGAPPAPRDEPPPALARAAPRPEAAPSLPREPELCAILAGVVAAEMDGFARLRSRQLSAESWLGRATLPGTERCTIEGAAWPRARYLCVGPRIGAAERDGAARMFDSLARELDQCLEQPIWFPRSWHRGEAFAFAMGERLQTWTDRTTRPATQVVLKVQQDATSHAYQVRLNLEPVP
jgi:hypothetical protein